MDLRQIMRDTPSYLLRGALVSAPVVLTLYVLYWIFQTVDQLLPIGIPGLGAALTVLLVGFVGFFSTNILGRSVLDSTERFLKRLPFVKLVYTSIKDLIDAFVGDKKNFNRPAL